MRQLCLLLLFPSLLHAQFNIPDPIVATGAFAITDTVYMSPDGDDANSGAPNAPVRSFTVALQKLPFGTAGINNGERYGLIRLMPGTYTSSTGFQQNENQWKQGNTYKNVSLEGIGSVIITGTLAEPMANHALRLVGNHIFVRNISLRRTKGIGLLINRAVVSPNEAGPSHLLIDNVTTDSTGSHGFLIQNADYVLVRNCKVLNSSRVEFSALPQSACSAWPSGLKLHFCRFVRVENSEVAYTRGEGLNFHNCEYGEAVGNRLHDNPTNFYNDNSARLVIRNNYLYQTPGATLFSNVCPQQLGLPKLAGAGILMANEGSCLSSDYGPTFQFCSAVQCSFLGFGAYAFPTIDSVFVYNNILQNCGKSFAFWEGNVNINGPNCIKNVFIAYNTCIGICGDSLDTNGAQAHFFFPDYNFFLNSYGQMLNVRFYGNLFSYDTEAYPAIKPIVAALNTVGTLDFGFDYNLWNKSSPYNGSHDHVESGLPRSFAIDSLREITPCANGSSGLQAYAIPTFADWIVTDYLGRPRPISMCQAGALEPDCTSSTESAAQAAFLLSVFPNPGSQRLQAMAPPGACLRLFDIRGQQLFEGHASDGTLELPVSSLSPGVYFVMAETANGVVCRKWVKLGH